MPRRAEAGVTAEVRTTAPIAMSVVNILDRVMNDPPAPDPLLVSDATGSIGSKGVAAAQRGVNGEARHPSPGGSNPRGVSGPAVLARAVGLIYLLPPFSKAFLV
jgi:hypothetical protein